MSTAAATDWTRILSDPDLVRQVGKLLQAYREAPPDKREQALLTAMREIKAGAKPGKNASSASSQLNCEWMKDQIQFGETFPTPAPVDA